MKISLITAAFSKTGVPLAQLRFAHALAKRGHQVTYVVGSADDVAGVPISKTVEIKVLQEKKVRSMLFTLIGYIRNEKPEIIFSAEDHLTVVVLLAVIFSFSGVIISGSSRILPTDRLAYSNKLFTKGWGLKKLMQLVMWRANALTCVSKDMVVLYRDIFKNAPHVSVYNIIKDEESIIRAKEVADHPWLLEKACPVIISAGTMTKRKGFADLIQAFSLVAANRRCRLIILGEGYLSSDLDNLIKELGLTDLVAMPGNVDNPLKFFSRSDVFVLSSYAEGMPNVLVEAMMCGCTPVSTDCPTGPRELLQDGKYGYLVPMRDPQAMAAAIESALDNPISKTLLDEAVEPFEENRVINRHFEVLGFCEK